MEKLRKHIRLWMVVLLFGVVFIVIGLLQDDFADTLRKAALICYECIGIG